eukprot:s740_g26.t1
MTRGKVLLLYCSYHFALFAQRSSWCWFQLVVHKTFFLNLLQLVLHSTPITACQTTHGLSQLLAG